jgi:hypothetical protein
MQGIEPHIEIATESFLTLGSLIAGTDRIALVQERLGHLLARAGTVRAMRSPFSADPLVEAMWWHPSYEEDQAHRWLRSLFIDAGIEIT